MRNRSWHLAQVDANTSLKLAREVRDPWFRAQALAGVARWIDDDRVEAVATESLASAEQCDDDYKRAAVAAWPIRALLERGHEPQARAALDRARARALTATPVAWRAEALLGLLQGAWGLGAPTRRQLTEDLAALERESECWRVRRALQDALGMLSRVDSAAASAIAERISDDKCRRKALAAIASQAPYAPRDYF